MKGFIYFLGSDHGIKVGRTTQPSKRLKLFGVKLPFKTKVLACFPVTDCVAAEAYYYQRYADRRLEGEWFSATYEQLCEEPKWDEVRWRYWKIPIKDAAHSELICADDWLLADGDYGGCWPEAFQEDVWFHAIRFALRCKERAFRSFPTRESRYEAEAKFLWRQIQRLHQVHDDLIDYLVDGPRWRHEEFFRPLNQLLGRLSTECLRLTSQSRDWPYQTEKDDAWPSVRTVLESGSYRSFLAEDETQKADPDDEDDEPKSKPGAAA